MRVKEKRKFERGGGSSQTPLEWKFRMDGGKTKKRSVGEGGKWIFSGTTQCVRLLENLGGFGTLYSMIFHFPDQKRYSLVFC